ncbi:heme ABC transporter ATP-binding protein [Fulvivirgaceae bacterium PWU4]|uniref:Heme ABC transporter ATP-binding protein n=1 Tax=Chryseosolibacter histidini TaxID=2782349 RepID=A0AAP2GLR1_9BACT|nr:heme ABC transporter ATP-binding protein [Chryseosolibacter histidini]MBT1700701.1 heme ABC transporter ATP-binding protein [Chryseosolibacter histidini]
MYQALSISLRVRDRLILNNVDITIRPGKFTAVVGPNGAGKSSLLKVLAHEQRADDGEVSINGKEISTYTSGELSLVRAVLPQSTTVQFAFSVMQIVMLGRHAHRTLRSENERILKEVMALTGVEAFRDRNYMTLSGGEKQRVQLARVLAQVWDETVYPRYILLDEPTSSLDIAQQQQIFGLARQVCERNIGVMAIVHDLNQAVQFADHLYFLKDGKIVASGGAREVFTKPNIEETFCCRVNVYHDPCNNCPYIIPERETFVYTPKLKIN